MRKGLAALVFSAALVVSGSILSPAEAGKSSGRSFSSGGHSAPSGRSFSSSHSSSGRSFSSGATAHGRSYSSGSSRPTASSPSRPSASANPRPSAPKATPSSPPPRTNPTKPVTGRSYSSGTTSPAPWPSRANPNPPASAPLPHPNGSPSGRHYSSGGVPVSGRNSALESPGQKPPTGSFDATAGRSLQMAESRTAYLKGRAPKTTYTDPGGVAHPVDPRDQTIATLRKALDQRRWENRELRRRQAFGPYYSAPPPVVVYHDPYSNLFWWWLLDRQRSLDERAYWAYNHQQSMDPARYRDLLAHDARLEARIRQLEAQNLPRDPTYRPNHLDPDLMYNTSYVEAAYNPQPALPIVAGMVVSLLAGPLGSGPLLTTGVLVPGLLPQPPAASASAGASTVTTSIPASPAHAPPHPAATGRAFRVLFTLVLVLGLMSAIIWLVFFKRWGGSDG